MSPCVKGPLLPTAFRSLPLLLSHLESDWVWKPVKFIDFVRVERRPAPGAQDSELEGSGSTSLAHSEKPGVLESQL